uniref:Uncharacterized protein n=1 Tax=Trichogramma kaykai TaxID=54128 RepID=A0ABD2WX31_9HYME
MAPSKQGKLDVLKSMREKVNWEIEDERHEFLSQLEPLIKYWNHRLPDLRDVFRKEEIDLLLRDSIDVRKIHGWRGHYYEGERFIDFVMRCGYKDEPDFDEDGEPLLRRTTAVHRVARRKRDFFDDMFVMGSELVRRFFKIYDRFDVNYSDEDGLTHFHAACHYGCYEELEKFLELGQDPNCLPRESNASSVDPPLHTAIKNNKEMFKFLLENGADPTVVNAKGLTLLHSLCASDDNSYKLVTFFELIDDAQKKVSIDLLDKFGRTPLQWAVEINYEGDPTYKKWSPEPNKLGLASQALIVIERLEERGYQLNRSGALTVMTFFSKHELFEKSTDLEKYNLYDDEEFLVKAKEMMINSNLSLYDLIRLRPEQAKQLKYEDYYVLAEPCKLRKLTKECKNACYVHLSEKIFRGFFRQWALDLFLELTGYQLPILCSEIIIKQLNNQDLSNMCLAVVGQI